MSVLVWVWTTVHQNLKYDKSDGRLNPSWARRETPEQTPKPGFLTIVRVIAVAPIAEKRTRQLRRYMETVLLAIGAT